MLAWHGLFHRLPALSSKPLNNSLTATPTVMVAAIEPGPQLMGKVSL